jgi:hypothetical protein
MAAAGNYVSETDIDNWPAGATEAEKQAVIDQVEELVEEVTEDLFYSASFDIHVDGNGKDRLCPGLKPDILSVTKIEISGVELPSSYYTHDKDFVYRDPGGAVSSPKLLLQYRGGLFPEGTGNIHVTGTYGHNTCHKNVKKACIILCRDENDPTLYTHRIQGQEEIGGESYKTDVEPLTGVEEADRLLDRFVNRKPMLSVV